MSKKCLNCATPLTDTFCAHCGQRASTHRFTLRRLFSKEFLADHLDLEKALPLTLRELITRPGGLIRDYLAGHRRKYFNFIALLLILLAAEALLMAVAQHPVSDVMMAGARQQLTNSGMEPEMLTQVEEGIQMMFSSQKFIFLIIVPLIGVVFYFLFRRTGYNFAEHMVAVVFILSMNTLLGILIGAVGLFPVGDTVFLIYYQIASIGVLAMDYVAIRWYTKTEAYTRAGGIWRSIVGLLVFIVLVSLGLQLTVGIWIGYTADKLESVEATE